MTKRALSIVLLLALAPVSAFANAGTPLMWAGLLHLFIGNAVIGAIEGLALARMFSVSKVRCGCWMIAANYASAWAGAFLLRNGLPRWMDIDLESARFWLWTLVVAAFLGTLLLELPFVFIALRKEPKRFRRAIGGNLAVQILSCIILFGWYWQAGEVSVLKDLKLTKLEAMKMPKDIMVYCIPTGLEAVCFGSLEDGRFIEIETLTPKGRMDRLAVEKAQAGATWSLVGVSKEGEIWPLLTNMTSTAALDDRRKDGGELDATHMNFGVPARLPTTNTFALEHWTGFWAGEGVRVSNEKTGARQRFALETPFVAWRARNATLLPDGKLLFQLGEDQICLLDAERKHIALVLRGRGPVVAIENTAPIGQ